MPYQPYTNAWQGQYLPQPQAMPQLNQGQPVMPMTQYQQPVNGIIKVNGRDSALQYQLPPNSTSIPLIDSSFDGKHGVFYVVSTDGAGTKTIELFDFTPHVDVPPTSVGADDTVTRQEFEELVARLDAMIGAHNGPDGPVQTTAATA